MIVVPANIKPSRSRNTLLDFNEFRAYAKAALAKWDDGVWGEAEVRNELEKVSAVPTPAGDNIHTSEAYRSIQFTCRQLIKLRNPLFDDLKELKSISKGKPLPDEAGRIIERIDLKYLQREVRFFYPFEVQVVDQASADQNEKGKSAHSEYKKAQIHTAMKRVMGSFLDAH